MENVLSHKPDVFVKILETLSEFRADRSQPPTALFNKLKQLLEPWPELLQGFAPFLMPEQAHKCGLVSIHGSFLLFTKNFDITQLN